MIGGTVFAEIPHFGHEGQKVDLMTCGTSSQSSRRQKCQSAGTTHRFPTDDATEKSKDRFKNRETAPPNCTTQSTAWRLQSQASATPRATSSTTSSAALPPSLVCCARILRAVLPSCIARPAILPCRHLVCSLTRPCVAAAWMQKGSAENASAIVNTPREE